MNSKPHNTLKKTAYEATYTNNNNTNLTMFNPINMHYYYNKHNNTIFTFNYPFYGANSLVYDPQYFGHT